MKMKTYLALFRGINVGGNNILPMKDLVKILEGMGFKDVRIYIQSGNAVFRSASLKMDKTAKEIGLSISKSHGFVPKVIILEISELKQAIDKNPFQTSEGKALHFFFLESQPKNPDLKALTDVKTKSEEFKLVHDIFYLFAPDGIGRSKLANIVEKKLGVPATGRNWNTISKLIELAEQ